MPRVENFSISINQFNGDSEYVDHFFNLIKQSARINKWSTDQTILFLKSKLAGPALKFFIESQELQNTDDLTVFESKFKTFFKNDAQQSTITDFNNLVIQQDETIIHFCHRLHVITNKVYKNISDESALDSIKYNKLLSVLPANFRIKLLEEKIQDFNKAMERAQEIQNIYRSEFQPNNNNTNVNSSQTVMHMSAQINRLSEKVDALTKEKSQTEQNNPQQPSRFHQRNPRNFRPQNRQFNDRQNRFTPRYQVKCQICSKIGHSADRCYRYLNNQRSNQNRNYNRYQSNRNQNSRYQSNRGRPSRSNQNNPNMQPLNE